MSVLRLKNPFHINSYPRSTALYSQTLSSCFFYFYCTSNQNYTLNLLYFVRPITAFERAKYNAKYSYIIP